MPSKLDKIPINNPKLDKRVKLTDADRENVKQDYETGSISITSLAKKYGVSKRLIQFILFPERQEKAKKDFAERQKDGRYYDKKKHSEQVQAHREHKKNLWNKGLLKKTKKERVKMTFEQIVSSLKDSVKDFIEAGETWRDNLEHNVRQIALNNFMDEFWELSNENTDERELLTDDACNAAMDYADELLEEIEEDED